MASLEHRARRYEQIAELERELSLVTANIATAKDHIKDMKAQQEGLIQAMRLAARDEGDLPLIDLMEEPAGGIQ